MCGHFGISECIAFDPYSINAFGCREMNRAREAIVPKRAVTAGSHLEHNICYRPKTALLYGTWLSDIHYHALLDFNSIARTKQHISIMEEKGVRRCLARCVIAEDVLVQGANGKSLFGNVFRRIAKFHVVCLGIRYKRAISRTLLAR